MKKIFYILLYSFVLVILFWSGGFNFNERGALLLTFFIFLFFGTITINVFYGTMDEK